MVCPVNEHGHLKSKGTLNAGYSSILGLSSFRWLSWIKLRGIPKLHLTAPLFSSSALLLLQGSRSCSLYHWGKVITCHRPFAYNTSTFLIHPDHNKSQTIRSSVQRARCILAIDSSLLNLNTNAEALTSYTLFYSTYSPTPRHLSS